MKQIPANIKGHYDALLEKREIPRSVYFHYLKWLRYYLDFCEKYNLNETKKENLVRFINKLRDKNQTAQQQKQAYHAVSLFYESAGPSNSDDATLLVPYS